MGLIQVMQLDQRLETFPGLVADTGWKVISPYYPC